MYYTAGRPICLPLIFGGVGRGLAPAAASSAREGMEPLPYGFYDTLEWCRRGGFHIRPPRPLCGTGNPSPTGSMPRWGGGVGADSISARHVLFAGRETRPLRVLCHVRGNGVGADSISARRVLCAGGDRAPPLRILCNVGDGVGADSISARHVLFAGRETRPLRVL